MNERKPIWKWILLIVSGTFIFLVLSQVAAAIGCLSNNFLVKSILLLLGGCSAPVLYAVWTKILERRPVPELDARRAFRDLSAGFAVGVLFISAVTGVLVLSGFYKVRSIDVNWMSLLMELAFYSIPAMTEEIIFRGIIFRMVEERFNVIAAFVVSSLIFGLMHLGSVDLWTAAAISAEAGFMLAAAYKVRNSLWLPMGIHWAWNFMVGPVFGIPVSGLPQEYSLLVPEISGPYVLTGGDNGIEGSLITCICGVLLGIAMLYMKKPENIRA